VSEGPDRSSLQETFEELADDELLRRCASGDLTELAQSIALTEVRARGLEAAGIPAAVADAPDAIRRTNAAISG
jgi:hypothetical protein